MSNDKYQSVELHISSLDEQVPLTPKTTPIAELGGYISGLSKLLVGGEITESDLLFNGVTAGSTKIAVRTAKVGQLQQNLLALTDKQYLPIQTMLRKYGRQASLVGFDGFVKKLLPASEPFCYEVFQEETFRGEVIRIGGKDDTVPFMLLSERGESINLTVTSKELARRLAAHLYDFIECHGSGLLRINPETFQWQPVPGKFHIVDFEVLEEADYAGWLSQLQSIPSLWRETEEPLLLIEEIRGAD